MESHDARLHRAILHAASLLPPPACPPSRFHTLHSAHVLAQTVRNDNAVVAAESDMRHWAQPIGRLNEDGAIGLVA